MKLNDIHGRHRKTSAIYCKNETLKAISYAIRGHVYQLFNIRETYFVYTHATNIPIKTDIIETDFAGRNLTLVLHGMVPHFEKFFLAERGTVVEP